MEKGIWPLDDGGHFALLPFRLRSDAAALWDVGARQNVGEGGCGDSTRQRIRNALRLGRRKGRGRKPDDCQQEGDNGPQHDDIRLGRAIVNALLQLSPPRRTMSTGRAKLSWVEVPFTRCNRRRGVNT